MTGKTEPRRKFAQTRAVRRRTSSIARRYAWTLTLRAASRATALAVLMARHGQLAAFRVYVAIAYGFINACARRAT
jgi:hypothetical protein